MVELLNTLNSMTPLSVIALLGIIIYMLVKNKKTVNAVAHNHLSGLPEMEQDVKEIVTLLKQQGPILQAINDNLIYVKARVNGKPN